MKPSEIVVGGRYTDGAGVVLEITDEKPLPLGRFVTYYTLAGKRAGTYQANYAARIAAWARERVA